MGSSTAAAVLNLCKIPAAAPCALSARRFGKNKIIRIFFYIYKKTSGNKFKPDIFFSPSIKSTNYQIKSILHIQLELLMPK